MNQRSSLVGTLLRKDLRLFGPFAALIALLQALWQFPNLVSQLGAIASLMQSGLQLGTMLLIMVVCHEDAVVSLKHDWLTRPIAGPSLLLAKSLFVFLAVILPAILGALLFNLTQGRTLGEATLAGVSSGASGDVLAVLPAVMAFAAITANVRQAVILLLAGLAAIALFTVGWTLSHRDVWESAAFTGSGWVLREGMQLVLAVAAICILWLQYRHRNIRASRGVAVAATIVGIWIVVLMGWSPVFALQKAFSADPQAAASVGVALVEGCLPVRVLDSNRDSSNDSSDNSTSDLTPQRYSDEHRRFAGVDAVAFSTRLIGQAPEGSRLVVDHVEVRYFSGDHQLQRLRPGRTSSYLMKAVDGRPVADHYWLLSAADATRFASDPGIQMRVNYSLSLLAPNATAQFAADGRRSYYDGMGYCGADFDRSSRAVAVSCFKPGAQPALLVASVDGSVEASPARRPLNFTPAIFDFWGGQRSDIRLVARGIEIPQVKVTAYGARAHFDRQIVRPGMLGGPVSACPAP